MKQPHTEQSIHHTDDLQNTGNHKEPGAKDAHGSDRFGGTRKGAENVEPNTPQSSDGREDSIETGTDVDKVSGLDAPNTSTKPTGNPQERHPERDENGRL